MNLSPVEERSRAVECYYHVKNLEEVAKKFNRSPSWVLKWVRRAEEGRSMQDLARSGRPKSLSPEAAEKARELLKTVEEGSTRRAARRLEMDGVASVSHVTVLRAAKQLGMRNVRERPRPLLTDAQKHKRVLFALTSRPAGYWRKVIFTDESPFLLFGPPRRRWVDEKEEPPVRPTVKHSPKIQVWGGICYNGKTPLVKIDQGLRLKASDYQEIIRESLPDIQALYPKRAKAVMMQDGAPCHRARSTLKALQEMGIRVLQDWPAQSPDLNPIENLWGTMQEKLYERDLTTVDELWAALQEEWDKLTLQDIRPYIDSMPRRLKQVIERNGNHVDY